MGGIDIIMALVSTGSIISTYCTKIVCQNAIKENTKFHYISMKDCPYKERNPIQTPEFCSLQQHGFQQTKARNAIWCQINAKQNLINNNNLKKRLENASVKNKEKKSNWISIFAEYLKKHFLYVRKIIQASGKISAQGIGIYINYNSQVIQLQVK